MTTYICTLEDIYLSEWATQAHQFKSMGCSDQNILDLFGPQVDRNIRMGVTTPVAVVYSTDPRLPQMTMSPEGTVTESVQAVDVLSESQQKAKEAVMIFLVKRLVMTRLRQMREKGLV